MSDTQTAKILKKAKDLYTISTDPLARKVLEIDLNALSAKNENLLSRLIRSLEQYVNKEKEIVYVGLMGHYSSGKSSTLNSLLEIDETQHQRETGLNPTDKSITLITHPKNSNSLILMNREEGNVPVRTTLIDNPLLDNLVIADTPGSGDPHILNEIIQDFLPICDFILYFISSTNPVDQADLPLLHQKSLKLPFIPVKYVITRADEFRIHRNETVSDSNLNQDKKNLFIGRLIPRIKQIVSSQELSTEDFVFIDNISKYNIDLLKNDILTATNDLNFDELLKIHGYKLEYYNGNLNTIFEYFLRIIDEKIKQSLGYEKTASENITRFDRSAEINNEKLKLAWTKSDSKFQDDYSHETTRLQNIKIDSLVSNISYDRSLRNYSLEVDKQIDNQAIGYFGRLVLDFNVAFKERVRVIKHSIFDNINKGELAIENLSHLFPLRLDLHFDKKSIEIDFSKVSDLLLKYSETAQEVLSNSKNTIKSQISLLNSLTNNNFTINSLEEQYNNGKLSIQDNFGQYFERIQMYRSTVLTRNTKETIEKLRIGTQLDELDDEFSEDFISNMTETAINGIYVDNTSDSTNLRVRIESHLTKVNELRLKLNNIVFSHTKNEELFGRENIDVSNIISSLTVNKEEKINLLYEDKLNSVLSAQKIEYDRFSLGKQYKIKNRKKIILKWTILTGLGFTIVYLVLKYLNYVNVTTMTASIVAGVASNLIGSTVGFIWSRFKIDKKTDEIESTKQFIEDRKISLLQEFNETFWDGLITLASTDDHKNNQVNLIKSIYRKKIDPEINNILTNNQTIYNQILEIAKTFNLIVDDYKTDLKFFYLKYSPVFADVDKNSEIIADITAQIKKVSIKPSFDLLEETTKSLETVRDRILEING